MMHSNLSRVVRAGALSPTAIAAFLLFLIPALANAQVLETKAKQAFMIDLSTGTVLLEKNAEERMPTASMSKIMTMYMLFEALKEGRIALDDTLPVSEHAWRKGGSKMFVEVGDRVRVEDLMRGVIVQSGNDASIVVAEGLAGSEEAFAIQMTERARELGLTNSNFRNATGWPDPDHFSTARDLAVLAYRIMTDFPNYYRYYAEREFSYAGITQPNRNPLLYKEMGADGLKTGHTEEAGYGLTASAQRGDRRLILVLNGLGSVAERSEEAERVMEWGFREFDTFLLKRAGEPFETASSWMGTPDEIPLVMDRDLRITLRRSEHDKVNASIRIQEPLSAPIQRGAQIATLVVTAPSTPPQEYPLYAGVDVRRKGFAGRVFQALSHMALGALN